MYAIVLLLFGVLLALVQTRPSSAMTFRDEDTGAASGMCDLCSWVSAAGEITPDTPKEFERFDAALHRKQERHDREHRRFERFDDALLAWFNYTIYFDSPGGDVMAAIRLGEMIRARRINTAIGAAARGGRYASPVKGGCVGACAFAFLGGVERTEKAGWIGLRQLSAVPAARQRGGKRINAAGLTANQLVLPLIDYISRMGADPRIVGVATSNATGMIHYVSRTQLQELRIVWDPRVFGPWTLEPSGNGIVARTMTPDRSETVTFFCTQDRIPRLQVDSPKARDERQTRQAIDRVQGDGFMALGREWPAAAASVRLNDGKPVLELMLAGFDADGLDATTDVAIRPPLLPHSAYYAFNYRLPSEQARETLRIAARNCV